MGDFVELIVFLAVVLVAMLAGGKKRGKQQQQRRPLSGRPPARPVRRATPAVPDREWREPEDRSAPPTPVVPTESAGEPTRQSVAREILELLGAQLEEQPAPPAPPTPPPRDAVALDDYRREAVSLERPPREPQALDAVELSRQREHDEFHDRYVDGCPMSGAKGVQRDFARWPGYERAWRRAFHRLWERRHGQEMTRGKRKGKLWPGLPGIETPDQLFEWWQSGLAAPDEDDGCQLGLW